MNENYIDDFLDAQYEERYFTPEWDDSDSDDVEFDDDSDYDDEPYYDDAHSDTIQRSEYEISGEDI